MVSTHIWDCNLNDSVLSCKVHIFVFGDFGSKGECNATLNSRAARKNRVSFFGFSKMTYIRHVSQVRGKYFPYHQ